MAGIMRAERREEESEGRRIGMLDPMVRGFIRWTPA
jgi:hypothetical protein